MSAGWAKNARARSTVARHEWKGLHRGGKLEDWVERQRLEAGERASLYLQWSYHRITFSIR